VRLLRGQEGKTTCGQGAAALVGDNQQLRDDNVRQDFCATAIDKSALFREGSGM
jgi:hypothetical protein